jgi:hypothetical protein
MLDLKNNIIPTVNDKNIYTPLVYFKDKKEYMESLLYTKFKKVNAEEKINKEEIYMDLLMEKHISYMTAINKLDIIDNKDRNNHKIGYDCGYNEESLNIKNNSVNVVKNNNKLIKFFTNKIKKYKYNYVSKEYIVNNIIEEHDNDIRSRKVSNRLLLPHYFFTSRYIEQSMPSQIRHWTSSVYNFIKTDKTGNNHLDVFTAKLIKLFFSLKYVSRKKVLSLKLLDGLKIVANEPLIENINELIKYTSNRTTSSTKELKFFPSIILTFDWLKEQIQLSSIFNKLYKNKERDILGGYFPKKKSSLYKIHSILIGKPLFRHTSFNLIIDLFIFNNKSYKINKLKNIIMRRSLYKYMYSMYIDYFKKIEETVNRPRFFYINLIEPKIYFYYRNIIEMYKDLLIKNNKVFSIYMCMLFLTLKRKFNNNLLLSQLNKYMNSRSLKNLNNNYIALSNNSKNYDIKDNSTNLLYTENLFAISKDIGNKNNRNIVFKRRLYVRKFNKNKINEILFKSNYLKQRKRFFVDSSNIDIYNDITNKLLIKDNKEISKNLNNKILISHKDINKRKSKHLKYKKYFEELERKSSTSVNLNSLTLWSREGLGKDFKKYNINKRLKKFGKDKFSYIQYKRKHFYEKLKGKKRPVNPKIWKKKLMGYYLYSRTQKKDTSSKKRFSGFKNSWKFNNFNNKFKKNSNKQWTIKNFKYFEYNNSHWKNNNNDLNYSKNYIKEEYKNKELKFKERNYSKNVILNSEELLKKREMEMQSLKFNETLLDKNEYINIINMFPYEHNKKIIFNKLFLKFYILNTKNLVKDFSNKDNKIKIINFLESKINEESNIVNFTNMNNNIINPLLSKKIYNQNNKKDILNIINNKYTFISSYNNFNLLNNKKIKEKLFYSKLIWDKLDFSIISLLSSLFMLDNISIFNISRLSFNSLYENSKNCLIYNNIWYVVYSIHYVKKEFYTVFRDVLMPNISCIKPKDNNLVNSYIYSENNNYEDIILNYKNQNDNIEINLWPGYYPNKRREEIKSKLPYGENLFKPYYRNIISLYIFESYKYFLKFCLGYKHSLFYTNNFLSKKIKSIIKNNYVIYNFIVVRTLLILLHHNYRSLIRVKPKLYYLNKLRYYKAKFDKLNLFSWLVSVRFIRTLRKTPRNFWKRYHKVASYYLGRVIQNAELDTKRKIFIPFVIYIEDIFFNIYGKWAVIRLWPLKRYYLSSYILAKRMLFLIYWRNDTSNPFMQYSKLTAKLMLIVKGLEIKKAYDHYINNYSRWPHDLINTINVKSSLYTSNYKNLEFIDYNSKIHTLNSYFIVKNNLSKYLPSLDSHYINNFPFKFKKLKAKFDPYDYKLKLINDFNAYKVSRLNYAYYWLMPLNSYLLNIKQRLDITGFRFRLSGRASLRRSNQRRIYITRTYGNFMGPTYKIEDKKNRVSIPTPRIRGYVKYNIDYSLDISKTRNGSISFKVWLSSRISTDVQELLIHLLRIKDLYTQLINRSYLVYSSFANLKNYYSYTSVKGRIKRFNY